MNHDASEHAQPKQHDKLLACLHFVGKFYGKVFSDTSLTLGLPLVEHCLTPSLFCQASERIGLKSKLVERPLRQIPPLVFPAVLVLKGNDAVVLLEKVDDETVAIATSELPDTQTHVRYEDLEAQYSGFALLVQPMFEFDQRSDLFEVEDTEQWFWPTLWRYRMIYLQVILATFLINLMGLVVPFYIMNVYDRVVPNNAFETLWALSIGVFLALTFDFILKLTKAKLIDVCGKKADMVLSARIMHKLMSIKTAAAPQSVGSMASNLKEFEQIREFFSSSTIAGLVDLPFIFISLTVIWMIAGPIAIVPILAVPLVLIASYFAEMPMRRSIESSMKASNQKHAILVEVLGNLPLIKSLSAQSYFQRAWETNMGQILKSHMTTKFWASVASTFSGSVIQMTTVVIVIAGVHMISEGHLTVGALVACTMLTGRSLGPLGQFSAIITRFNQSKTSLNNLNQMMALPSERSQKQVYTYKQRFDGKVALKNVHFSYPNAKIPALEGVSITIEAGEHVAILGHNGSGKSTLQQMLLGHYEPDEGLLTLDDTDLAQIDPADLRRNVGYVAQDCRLFYGTLRHNITLGKPWATHEELYRAAELAGLASFVKRHPDGYDMLLGEGGIGLSGGQRQAVTVARALMHNPPILLLDEPTSAMDRGAEKDFIEAMQTYAKDKTLIVVTHKDELLALVDRVIVMHEGKVVSDRSKAEMMQALKQQANTPRKVLTPKKKPDQAAS